MHFNLNIEIAHSLFVQVPENSQSILEYNIFKRYICKWKTVELCFIINPEMNKISVFQATLELLRHTRFILQTKKKSG